MLLNIADVQNNGSTLCLHCVCVDKGTQTPVSRQSRLELLLKLALCTVRYHSRLEMHKNKKIKGF